MKRLLGPICTALAGVIAGALSIRSHSAGSNAKSFTVGNEKPAGERRRVAGEPRSSEDALGTALSTLVGKCDLRGLAELGSALRELDSTQIGKLLDRIERDTSQPPSARLNWLFEWWVKRDPAAASAWIRPRLDAAVQDGPPGSMFLTHGRGRVIVAWAKADPRAALDYARLHVRTGLAIELLRAAMEGWADQDTSQRLAVLLDFPAGKARAAGLESFLSNWAKRDPAAALSAARTLGVADGRDKAIAGVLQNWAERDAASAFAQYRALGLSDPTLLSSVLRSGAAANPAQAVEWLAQLDAAQFARGASEIVEKWAERDPVAALGWALDHGVSLAASVERTYGVAHNSLGRTNWVSANRLDPFGTALEKQPAATLAWVRSLPAGEDRDRFMELAAKQSKDLDQTLALFSELPADAAARIANRIGSSYHSDPQRVQEWAASLPAGPVREQAWAGIGRVIGKPLPPPGPDRDAMLSGMVRPIGTPRPPADTLALAVQIGDLQLRRDMIDEAMDYYVNLSSDKMASDARAWLENADFPGEWKVRWRK
jgi:hypothetical protein